MLDFGVWQEIISTMRKNKLRTFLTSFSVFWGIFILMILLGSGTGLQKGVMHNFSDATNSVWLWGGRTTIAHAGYNIGRQITLKNDDIEYLSKHYQSIENLSGRLFLWGGEYHTSYKNQYGDFEIQAIHPGYQKVENIKVTKGRPLNLIDIEQYRKVAIIGRIVVERLFKNEDPIGKYVNVSGIPFLVVGMFDDIHDGEVERLYIPISVAQKTFLPGNDVGSISFTSGDLNAKESEALIEAIKKGLAKKHKIDESDQSALGSYNALEDYQNMQTLFAGIKLFVGIIGIFTLIAGIVGVSNIMLIVVKERTKEFGVRKAIGATPASIVSLIILEALIVTSIAGFLGMFAGISILEVISNNMPASEFFRNPGVDFKIAIGATILIAIAGMLAGLVPARRASRIKPIVALRDE